MDQCTTPADYIKAGRDESVKAAFLACIGAVSALSDIQRELLFAELSAYVVSQQRAAFKAGVASIMGASPSDQAKPA